MQEEIFPLVDETGKVIGQAARSRCHDGSKLLHPVIHLHVFNTQGQLYLQKRAASKEIEPNKWDSSVGGHIDLGETAEEAAHREGKEEIGLVGSTIYYLDKYVIETEIERELTYCFYTVYDGSFCFDETEVQDGRFWSIQEIASSLSKGIFTPNFEYDFNLFLHNGLQWLLGQNNSQYRL
ncbi:MAG: hypothetical protein RL662_2111 [Bacteroidota bacterium]|jgi:isopentenyldiphosphate isomerase